MARHGSQWVRAHARVQTCSCACIANPCGAGDTAVMAAVFGPAAPKSSKFELMDRASLRVVVKPVSGPPGGVRVLHAFWAAAHPCTRVTQGPERRPWSSCCSAHSRRLC